MAVRVSSDDEIGGLALPKPRHQISDTLGTCALGHGFVPFQVKMCDTESADQRTSDADPRPQPASDWSFVAVLAKRRTRLASCDLERTSRCR